jgi:hypothetical protein
MRLPFCLPALLLFAAASAAPAASAQDIFVTPIPNVPFSGVVNVQQSFVGKDKPADYWSVREIGRDSQGRIHNEMRVFELTSDSTTPPVVRVHLYDPQTRTNTYLDPQKHVFWKDTVNHPPATVPPSPVHGSAPQQGLPKSDFTREEDLGVTQIDGVSAHGFRETQTVAPDGGAGESVVITDEYWYSDELRIYVKIVHSDPRTGSVTLTVTHVVRTEPDPSVFEIPDGYQPRGANAE